MVPAAFFNSLNIFWEGNYSKLSSLHKRYGDWQTAFENEGRPGNPEKDWERLRSLGIELVLRDSTDFPKLLREIPYQPFGLYIKGSLNDNISALGIVGTRKASEEGVSLAFEFGRFVSERGLNTVSGLAFGVDKSAHEGALSASGKTTAVLPGGLDSVYPASHTYLAKKIMEMGGALVSEYPLGHRPAPYNFLERNRIISGLSKGVVIIEAPETSGALVTARFALEQNREVFVVPGPARHKNYAGSHELIKSGAALVTHPREILECLGIPGEPEEKLATSEERAILKVLRSAGRPLNLHEIIELSELPAPIVSQAVSFLVLKSKISDHGAQYEI